MPLYDYACTACGRVSEVRHGFDETYDTPCAACGAPLRRVFNPAPVLFKGSGFYVTDSRRAASAGKDKVEKPKDAAATPSSAAGKSDASASDTKSPAKPSDSAA